MHTQKVSFKPLALALGLSVLPLLAGCGGGGSSSSTDNSSNTNPTKLSLGVLTSKDTDFDGFHYHLVESVSKTGQPAMAFTVQATNTTSGPLNVTGSIDPTTGRFVWTPYVAVFNAGGSWINAPEQPPPIPGEPAPVFPTLSLPAGQSITGTTGISVGILSLKGTYYASVGYPDGFGATPPDGTVFVAQ